MGYDTRTLPVGGSSVLDVVLTQQVQEMERVVVTALGIKRAEKALSYNVQQVDVGDIASNKDANFLNSLSGKVAGVNINASSSGVGGASRVIMRGQKSINQSSNALYVIDGVPIQTLAGEGEREFGSRGSTDPMADINPEDIESITVLTGAAAAALYGSSAANGAIVVTTKRGQAGTMSVTVSSSTELMTPFVLPEFQNRYGTGDLSSSTGSTSRSWGRRLNSANMTGYDPRKDYFQLGVAATETVSLSTGTERNQTYLSGSALNSKGIVPNNKYDRYNFTFRNTTKFLDDKMTLDVNASYILQQDRNVTNQGTYNNPIVGAYLFPRSNNWDDIRMYERWDVVRKINTQYWPVGDEGMTMQNPYWVNYRNLRENRKDRYMLGATLSYDILDWLNVTGRIRMDNTVTDYTSKMYATTVTTLTGNSDRGYFGMERNKDRQIYGDAFININKTFGEDWSLSANVGASFTDMYYDGLAISGAIADGSDTFGGEAVGLTNKFTVENLSRSKRTTPSGWREQTQSLMGQAEVGFRGTYYLTLTARNDWPSHLAGPASQKSSFFYPSVGVSVLLSELLPRMENLSYLKLRASYADVGTPFQRWIANPLHPFADGRYGIDTLYPVDNLLPERTGSFEVGLTARFFRHFNFDISYYNSHTRNQTFNPPLSGVTGSSSVYVQSGNVLNEGIELALGYRNTWGKFSWDTNYTFSTNRNKIVKLAENTINPLNGQPLSLEFLDQNGLGQAHFILKEGGTLGDLYSLIDLKYDSNGAVYIDKDGVISTQTLDGLENYIKLGSVLPKANMAWRNDFSVGNFNFGFMISARIGGVVFSRTQAMLDYYGVSEASAAARDAEAAGNYIIINGGEPLSANQWFSTIAGGTAIPQYYTYSATNVRLQEASIGYTIPRKWLGGACDITVSVVGRNLWMIYNKAPFDPESTATMNNYYQGIDYFMMPSLRNVGFNLRMKF